MASEINLKKKADKSHSEADAHVLTYTCTVNYSLPFSL